MVLLLNRESDGGEVLEEGGKGGERESERENIKFTVCSRQRDILYI